MLRFRDAFTRAVTPSRSGMSGDAPCLTSHFSSAGSNSFSMPMCSAVRPRLSCTLTFAPLSASAFAALNRFQPQHARNGVTPTTTSLSAPASISSLRMSHVVPPTRGVQAGRLRAALDQQLDDGGVAAERGRKPDRLAEIRSGAAFLFDVESAIEQERRPASRRRLPACRSFLQFDAAGEVQQVPALIVPDLRAAQASPRGSVSSPEDRACFTASIRRVFDMASTSARSAGTPQTIRASARLRSGRWRRSASASTACVWPDSSSTARAGSPAGSAAAM